MTHRNFITTLILLLLLLSILRSCKKEVTLINVAGTAKSLPPVPSVPVLKASITQVVLKEATADEVILHLEWYGFNTNGIAEPDYHIEACMAGKYFDEWVEIGETAETNFDFTTKEFNQQIRKLMVSGLSEDVLIRIKLPVKDTSFIYSCAEGMQVTTYQPTIVYDDQQVIRIPGNYENWKIESAPTIVSTKRNGLYEGYIEFTDAYPMFLMIKSDHVWNPLTTFYDIGANKFGYGGNIFGLRDGEGIYLIKANTATNKWSCKKINNWNIEGTSVNGYPQLSMLYNSQSHSWEITRDFLAGSFIFSDIDDGGLNFGHNSGSEPGVPDYDGTPIKISQKGNYTIRLSLTNAGNYSYGILRNN